MMAVSAPPALPALVRGKVHHTRHRPIRHSFTHVHDQWLIDLDEGTGLPGWLRRLTDVHPQDHLAAPSTLADLRTQVLDVVEQGGVDTGPVTRVVMLAHARVLGHVFDPLTTYWCLDGSGAVVAAVLEVRNTYGGRHAYVVQPGPDGRAVVDKAFVVSPFNGVEGTYDVRLTLGAERVSVAIRLQDNGSALLTTSVWGSPEQATTPAVVRAVIRTPLMPQRVSALIRWHGIRLWARRLPVRSPKGVSR